MWGVFQKVNIYVGAEHGKRGIRFNLRDRCGALDWNCHAPEARKGQVRRARAIKVKDVAPFGYSWG